MREFLSFVASLAAAAILTAVAILFPPESPLWKWMLWSSIAVFAACASVLLIDYLSPSGSRLLLGGMWCGIALTVGAAIAFFVGSPVQIRDEKLPGVAVAMVLDIQDVAALRRKYVFEYTTPEHASTALANHLLLGEIGAWPVTFTNEQIEKRSQNARDFYKF